MSTLLLSRSEVERLLTPDLCIAAVEEAFRLLALGKVPPPGILGMHAGEGSFHVKAGFLTLERPYFAAKLNANFPGNGARHGLPTIQGAVLLSDASNGAPLAIMDSMSITALRTAAASAVAAKYLARRECETLLVVGCGGQAPAQLQALLRVCRPRRVLAYDVEARRAAAFAASMVKGVAVADDLARAAGASDIIVTCTTSKRYVIEQAWVRPGAFIAAVGADNEDKQEMDPRLMAAAKVVTDVTDQACRIGDLHHAIEAGAMRRESVYAELGEVVAGLKPGRTRNEEIILFDSTGTGLQDVAAAIAAYRKAIEENAGTSFAFSERRAA
ncbi:MAG TPA: ornithine cyclodeaminase family protein [Burkholderiales bacterium]|nr:ornithine cyclodeaminase family protein [Burkholderiales bacterium]